MSGSGLKVDFSKPYAKRRDDEARSHYAERLKFIHELRRGEPDIDDTRIEVLSNCYVNVKFLSTKYHPDVMTLISKYDPDLASQVVSDSIAHMKTAR